MPWQLLGDDTKGKSGPLLTPRDAEVPFGARLLSDVANLVESSGRRGTDCNEATLLDARWGDVPRRVGAAFFFGMGMSVVRCLLWQGVICYGQEVSHTYDS